MVILCLEGGPGTVNTMASGIKMGVPCVIIDGSGRAADVVAYAYSKLVLYVSTNKDFACLYLFIQSQSVPSNSCELEHCFHAMKSFS